jgi:Na+/phosphate symporter
LYEHLENQHKPFVSDQANEMMELIHKIDDLFNFALHIVKEDRFDQIEEMIVKRDSLVDDLIKLEKIQIKRIKGQGVNTRNSILYFNIITETKNLLMSMVNLMKSHRDFITLTQKNKSL